MHVCCCYSINCIVLYLAGEVYYYCFLLSLLLLLLLLLQSAGADGLELNLSCPHGMGERGMGLACGQVYSAAAASLSYHTHSLFCTVSAML